MLNITTESIEVQKKVNNAINEIVNAEIKKQDLTSFIADVKNRIKEETGMSKSELSKRAKIRLLKRSSQEKFEEEKEFGESAFEENDILEKL